MLLQLPVTHWALKTTEMKHDMVLWFPRHAADFLFFFLHLLPTANSSSAIQVLSTEHGIILHSNVTYYHEEQRVGWLHK